MLSLNIAMTGFLAMVSTMFGGLWPILAVVVGIPMAFVFILWFRDRLMATEFLARHVGGRRRR